MDTRITICLTDGVLRGASHQSDNGLPTELDLSGLATIAPDINAASLARVTELETDLATATTALQALESFRVAMVEKVTAVLQSGDPEKFAALALEFLTPEQEKIRAEKLAQLAALKAELGIP